MDTKVDKMIVKENFEIVFVDHSDSECLLERFNFKTNHYALSPENHANFSSSSLRGAKQRGNPDGGSVIRTARQAERPPGLPRADGPRNDECVEFTH
jgi:hypothetical protein